MLLIIRKRTIATPSEQFQADIGVKSGKMVALGVCESRIDLNRFVGLTVTNHACTYGHLPRKGTIAIGADADLAIPDPQAQWTIADAAVHGASDYSPYGRMQIQGRPETVVSRGKVMVRNGMLEGTPKDETYLDRPAQKNSDPSLVLALRHSQTLERTSKESAVHAR